MKIRLNIDYGRVDACMHPEMPYTTICNIARSRAIESVCTHSQKAWVPAHVHGHTRLYACCIAERFFNFKFFQVENYIRNGIFLLLMLRCYFWSKHLIELCASVWALNPNVYRWALYRLAGTQFMRFFSYQFNWIYWSHWISILFFFNYLWKI